MTFLRTLLKNAKADMNGLNRKKVTKCQSTAVDGAQPISNEFLVDDDNIKARLLLLPTLKIYYYVI